MKRVILCPNPYRDGELTVAKHSKEILEAIGFETVVCLPFSREGYDDQLGVPIRQLQQEIKRADMLIAFGGDGTILHLARTHPMCFVDTSLKYGREALLLVWEFNVCLLHPWIPHPYCHTSSSWPSWCSPSP